MTELYFLRHGQRIDHALGVDQHAEALYPSYEIYDPSLSTNAVEQIESAAEEIGRTTTAFTESTTSTRKNVFIHFSPYLRCCQSADLLVSEMKRILQQRFPNYKVRFQLLGDFALSEWIHDKMKNKPPFIDSNDAYNMYTPNLKVLKNRSSCSNFRPTNTLGPYNGPDLSYKDYQARCKSYFKKLLATYDKPSYIKTNDIIIVIAHGYVINNFLSYFINHPIFEEIPEASINFAKRILKDEEENVGEPKDDFDCSRYTWKLLKDSLGMLGKEDTDSTLNLETDIVYYKTNFIKRDELNAASRSQTPSKDKPRPSFKIESTTKTYNNTNVVRNYNPIFPAARNWTPQLSNQYKIKSDFQLKVINDESFKKSFNLTNHPAKPITPEVSPNSEPTRSNSVIDLTKLIDNNDIYKPMKLKYSTASEIPIHHLNSKVNSQVNLAQFQRSEYASSNDSSSVDLPKFLSSLQNRKRSLSNPINVTVSHNAKDSYFPSSIISKVKSFNIERQSSESLPVSVGSGSPLDQDLKRIEENHDKPFRLDSSDSLAYRSSSINYKKNDNTTKSRPAKNQQLQQQAEQQRNVNENENEDIPQKFISLAFNNSSSNVHNRAPKSNKVLSTSPNSNTRSRNNSIKFNSSVLTYESRNESPDRVNRTSTGFDKYKNHELGQKMKPMFYHLNSDDSNSNSNSSSSNSSDDERKMDIDNSPKNEKNDSYIWFGQNRR